MPLLDFKDIDFLPGFWKDRYELNATASVTNIIKVFTPTRFKAMHFGYKKEEKDGQHRYYGSDVAKLLEAIAYLIEKNPGKYPEYEKVAEEMIDCIIEKQLPTGYFNTYYQVVCLPDEIFTHRQDHELYNLGHWIEAAVAYHKATGKDRFLKAMIRYVDYVEERFVRKGDTGFVTPGHEEIEIALMRLYEHTGEKRFFDLAAFFLEKRGNNDKDTYVDFGNDRYAQDYAPIREQTSLEGHAVRAVYLLDGMAKYNKVLKDPKLLDALHTLYKDMLTKQYISGGLGSYRIGEIITTPYDVPNLTAYTESCAAIGEMMFLLDLYDQDPKKEYHDQIERILYNGFLSSTSIDGKSFFYENPLEIRVKDKDKETSVTEQWRWKLPITQRVEMFECSCCPPNIARFIASMGKYIYWKGEDAIYLNQFVSSVTEIDGVKLTLKSGYPATFDAEIAYESKKDFTLKVRIPWYSKGIDCDTPFTQKDGYMVFSLKAGSGKAMIAFKAAPRLVEANPRNWADQGKVALMYGPIVYCLEAVDNGEELNALFVKDLEKVEMNLDITYGMHTFTVEGFRKEESGDAYAETYEYNRQALRFIPYCRFANRGESDMLVWVNKI